MLQLCGNGFCIAFPNTATLLGWLCKSFNHLFKKVLSLISQSNVFEEHFTQLAKIIKEQKYENNSFENYIIVLDSLIEDYTKIYPNFEEHTLTMKLAFEPHLIHVGKVSTKYQMEFIE